MALQAHQVDELAAAISGEPNLRLPARLTENEASQAEKIQYLGALLRHDPGVFLERHGKHLDRSQRANFEPLRQDYEVNFYMSLLEDQEAANGDAKV